MSSGMSHQKEPGGQSRGRRKVVLIPGRGLTGPPPPAAGRQLTLLPVHQDGAVGPGRAVALHGVAVVTVVLLVPEGAVLHHLLRCTTGSQQAPLAPQGPPPPGAHPQGSCPPGPTPQGQRHPLGKNTSPLHRSGILTRSIRVCKSVPHLPILSLTWELGFWEMCLTQRRGHCGPAWPGTCPCCVHTPAQAGAPVPDSLVPNQLCPWPGSMCLLPGFRDPSQIWNPHLDCAASASV